MVPAGGGGLAAGVAVALRAHGSITRRFAVEPEGYNDLGRWLAAGERQRNEIPTSTLCDALQAVSPGALPFSVMQQASCDALQVTDEQVRFAMRTALERLKLVLEPSGASALAAALAGKSRIPDLGERVGVVCSGGNIAAEDFAGLVSAAERH